MLNTSVTRLSPGALLALVVAKVAAVIHELVEVRHRFGSMVDSYAAK